MRIRNRLLEKDWEIPKAWEAGEFQRPHSLLKVAAQGRYGYRREGWNVAYFLPCSAVLAKLVEIHRQTIFIKNQQSNYCFIYL